MRRLLQSGLMLGMAGALVSCPRAESSTPGKGRGEPALPAETGPVGDLIPPPTRPASPGGGRFLGLSVQHILATISHAPVVAARSTGGQSLSMYVRLDSQFDGAFKPRTRRGQRWNGEVAAYRLGRVLKIDRVPPSTTRWLRLSQLERLLAGEPAFLERFRREVVRERDDTVRGALTYWLPVIRPAEVERLDQLPRWSRWLQQGRVIPPDRVALAQQLSNLIVFDYVAGNWDRWSGGNVYWDAAGETLLLMDNNAGFGTRFAEPIAQRLRAPLSQVERFSATLYRRLVGLRREDFRAELAQDPAGVALLTAEQITAVLQRRREVVARIDRLGRQYHEDRVLCFP